MEIDRIAPDAEYSRRAQGENEVLQEEIRALWQELRALDPTKDHIHGTISECLVQQERGVHLSLPSLQPPPHWPNGQPPPLPTSMQGLEYEAQRIYGRR